MGITEEFKDVVAVISQLHGPCIVLASSKYRITAQWMIDNRVLGLALVSGIGGYQVLAWNQSLDGVPPFTNVSINVREDSALLTKSIAEAAQLIKLLPTAEDL